MRARTCMSTMFAFFSNSSATSALDAFRRSSLAIASICACTVCACARACACGADAIHSFAQPHPWPERGIGYSGSSRHHSAWDDWCPWAARELHGACLRRGQGCLLLQRGLEERPLARFGLQRHAPMGPKGRTLGAALRKRTVGHRACGRLCSCWRAGARCIGSTADQYPMCFGH